MALRWFYRRRGCKWTIWCTFRFSVPTFHYGNNLTGSTAHILSVRRCPPELLSGPANCSLALTLKCRELRSGTSSLARSNECFRYLENRIKWLEFGWRGVLKMPEFQENNSEA